MQPSGVITLTTDFGGGDSYAAQMKGIILRINPDAAIIDISHGVQPREIREAAFLLMTACDAFPRGTVHIAVVDPGVGGQRKALLIQTPGEFFIGPDNGVLSWALRRTRILRAVAITHEKYILPGASPTFHGRDIFAPAAAYLSMGVDPAGFGRRITRIVRLGFPAPKRKGGRIEGQVIHCDVFGNLVTNIPAHLLRGKGGSGWRVKAGDKDIHGIARTYVDARESQPLALIGSSGFLEISVNKGSAREAFGKGAGLKVWVISRNES